MAGFSDFFAPKQAATGYANDYDVRAAQIARRRRMADLLQNQAFQQEAIPSYSTGALPAIAKIFQAWASNKVAEDANKDEAAVTQERNAAMTKLLENTPRDIPANTSPNPEPAAGYAGPGETNEPVPVQPTRPQDWIRWAGQVGQVGGKFGQDIGETITKQAITNLLPKNMVGHTNVEVKEVNDPDGRKRTAVIDKSDGSVVSYIGGATPTALDQKVTEAERMVALRQGKQVSELTNEERANARALALQDVAVTADTQGGVNVTSRTGAAPALSGGPAAPPAVAAPPVVSQPSPPVAGAPAPVPAPAATPPMIPQGAAPAAPAQPPLVPRGASPQDFALPPGVTTRNPRDMARGGILYHELMTETDPRNRDAVATELNKLKPSVPVPPGALQGPPGPDGQPSVASVPAPAGTTAPAPAAAPGAPTSADAAPLKDEWPTGVRTVQTGPGSVRTEGPPRKAFDPAGEVGVGGEQLVRAKHDGSLWLKPTRYDDNGQPIMRRYNGATVPQSTLEKDVEEVRGLDTDLALADKVIGAVKDNPNAFGPLQQLNALPLGAGAAFQEWKYTPKEIAAQTLVGAQAGDLLHKLYGAALSLGEQARASKFIPKDGDSAALTVAKIEGLSQIIREKRAQMSEASRTTAGARRGSGATGTWGGATVDDGWGKATVSR